MNTLPETTRTQTEISAIWDMLDCGDITQEQATEALLEVLAGSELDNRG